MLGEEIKETLWCEVAQHLGGGHVRAVALGSTDGLQRGAQIEDTGDAVQVPVGDAVLGRVFNLVGEPIDGRGPVAEEGRRSIHHAPPAFDTLSSKTELFETGIKVMDLLCPLVRGGKAGLFGGAGVGKTVIIQELIARLARFHSRLLLLSPASASVPAKATTCGSRCRKSMIGDTGESVMDKTVMVFGQMNEPPGARLRVALSALTMAEHFRDNTGADTLLFVDNIFRFSQAGSEVSALLGRMPSAVGYQPTLGTEMGELQERITSTSAGAVTSIQAIYVPADDYTDPAPATAFAHLDSTVNLERSISDKGIYPAVDPLAIVQRVCWLRSTSARALPGRAAGAADLAALQGLAGHHRDPRHRRAVRRGQDRRWPRAQDRALPVAALLRRRAVHRLSGASTAVSRDTIRSFDELCDGKWDHLPEAAFMYVGKIEEAAAKAERLAA